MTTKKHACTIAVTYKCNKLNYIKSIFHSENIMHPNQISVRTSQSTYGDPQYISMSQKHQTEHECYLH